MQANEARNDMSKSITQSKEITTFNSVRLFLTRAEKPKHERLQNETCQTCLLKCHETIVS